VLNYSLVSLVAGNYSLSRDFISSGIAIVGVRDKYIIIATSALNFWQTNFLVYKNLHHEFSSQFFQKANERMVMMTQVF
jgi:hypothetical protein